MPVKSRLHKPITRRRNGANKLKGVKQALRSRDPLRTSAAILAAALEEFTVKGHHGARVDAIAKRAQVNKRMLYHYFGDKDALYLAVLEGTYVKIRSAERGLNLADFPPKEAVRKLVQFTWNYFLENPEFLSLLGSENLNHAKFLKRSAKIFGLHSPLISVISGILDRGVREAAFRRGIDPVQLYITIASLGFFYLSNKWTLSTIFRRDLMQPKALEIWGEHIADVVLAFVTGQR